MRVLGVGIFICLGLVSGGKSSSIGPYLAQAAVTSQTTPSQLQTRAYVPVSSIYENQIPATPIQVYRRDAAYLHNLGNAAIRNVVASKIKNFAQASKNAGGGVNVVEGGETSPGNLTRRSSYTWGRSK